MISVLKHQIACGGRGEVASAKVEISPVIPTFFWLFYNFDIPLKKELN